MRSKLVPVVVAVAGIGVTASAGAQPPNIRNDSPPPPPKGGMRPVELLILDACLAMRLPDKGSKDQTLKPMDTSRAWLAPLLSDTAVPAAEYQRNPAEVVWLPNEAVARDWMEYVKTGAVGDTSPPPAPTGVKVSPQGERGTEVTWRAEADFESGISQFIILRDGQDLAKVPEKPQSKFGRPLFQGMTYHDTPDQPLSLEPRPTYTIAASRWWSSEELVSPTAAITSRTSPWIN
ncbi:MAG: hypothetical protein ACLP9L_14060 [Thermoguttaceae bacterium]